MFYKLEWLSEQSSIKIVIQKNQSKGKAKLQALKHTTV